MRINYLRTLHLSTVLILLVFPKAGILAGSVPIYISTLWGTLLILLCTSYALSVTPKLARIYFVLAFVTAVIWLTNLSGLRFFSVGSLAQLIFNLTAVLSVALVFYPLSSPASLATFLRYFKFGYYFIIIYALLQRVFGPSTVAIKNLTATYSSSFAEILGRHNILYGLSSEAEMVSKAFSTYQNGNLFGISLVLCLPIALSAEKNDGARLVMFCLAAAVCVFTASAGAMVGFSALVFFFAMQALRTGRLSKNIALLLSVLPVCAIIFLIVNGIPSQFEALLQSRLLGRDFSTNLRWMKVSLWWQDIGMQPLLLFHGDLTPSVAVFEVLPIAITQFFGIFVAILFYAFLIIALNLRKFEYYKIGALVYLLMSMADGGLWLTPTPYLVALNVSACRAMDRFPDWAGYLRQTHFTWGGRPMVSF